MSDDSKELGLVETLKTMKVGHYLTTFFVGFGAYWGMKIGGYFLLVFLYYQLGRETYEEYMPKLQWLSEAQIFQLIFDDSILQGVSLGVGFGCAYLMVQRYSKKLAHKNRKRY